MTIEENDDIVGITFFIAKLLKKATRVTITFYCNKAFKEGDDNNVVVYFFFFATPP